MQRTILGCSVLGLRLLKQKPLDVSWAIDEALTVMDAVDAGQQPLIDLSDDALIAMHALLTIGHLASQTVEAGETRCLLAQHQAFYRAAMGLQFLPEISLKQKSIALLLLQLILDDHENDSVFSFELAARTRLQLTQRIDALHQALLKCVSKNQSLYLMWRSFNPDSQSKIVALSENDRNIDWIGYKIQACEAVEAASSYRVAEIDTATQALKVEFAQRKQAIRDHYAMMIAVECSKIDTDTADMKRAAKRQRKKDAIKLLIVTAASAGVAAGVGAALQSSMLAANAAANTAAAGAATATATTTVAATTTAGVAGAAVAAPTTLTFTQTMVLGAVRGLSMSTTQALITGDNVLKRALEGGILGAAAGGVGHKLGKPQNTAQILKKQVIQSATSAGLQTAFHGGNLGQNVVVAVAANIVANAVLPMEEADLEGLNLVGKSLRTAGHAGVIAATATALHASPEARANIVIAAVAGMITPAAESVGQRAVEAAVAHRERAKQTAVFKQELTRLSEDASEALEARGVHVPAETIKTRLQQHPDLQGSPEAVQARLMRRGAIEEGDSVQTGAAASLARGVAWVLGATLDLLIPAAHADVLEKATSADKLATKPLLKLYDSRVVQANMNRPNAFEQAIDGGVVQGAEVVADIVRHPVDTIMDLGVMIFDGYNELADLSFGISTEGSRFRNAIRGRYIVDGYELFSQSDSVSKAQTLTAIGTAVGEACVAGHLARQVALEGLFFYQGRNLHTKTHSKNGIPHIFSQVKGQPKHGHYSKDTLLNRREIVKTQFKKENFLGKDQYGKAWYAGSRWDGKQPWSVWRNGKLISAGINETSIDIRSIYGLTGGAASSGAGWVCKPVIAVEFYAAQAAVQREENIRGEEVQPGLGLSARGRPRP